MGSWDLSFPVPCSLNQAILCIKESFKDPRIWQGTSVVEQEDLISYNLNLPQGSRTSSFGS